MGRHVAESPVFDGASGTANVTSDLGGHEPVGGWLGGMEQRTSQLGPCPYLAPTRAFVVGQVDNLGGVRVFGASAVLVVEGPRTT